jgi:hypothetical protein
MDNEILEQKKTALEMERAELNLLVQRGFKFTISVKVRRRAKGLRGLFGKAEAAEEAMTFEIQEPTLSVLDRISDIAIDMMVNGEELTDRGQEVIAKARKIAKENAMRMARVVAIAVLGEDYHVTRISPFGGRLKRRNDDRKFRRLTDLFFHAIRPSQLAEITAAVTNISNLGDFIASMRLLSGARTTQPRKNRIE